MAKIFFTSDLHFSHKNIAKFCPAFRPATNHLEELDEFMIARWNETVSPEDVVYNLGDVSFAREFRQVESVLYRLNGAGLFENETARNQQYTDFVSLSHP